MRKDKASGFGDFSVSELQNLEEGFYFLILGGEIVMLDGVYSLTKKEAEKKFEEIFYELVDITREGLTKTDRKHALDLIGRMFIVPARIH